MVHGLPDRSNVTFDDERVVVNAGLVLAVTLGRRLGLEALIDAAVKLGGRPGAAAGAQGAVVDGRDAAGRGLHR